MKDIKDWLKPLPLSGGGELKHRVMPGPMEGIMNPLFCETARRLNLVDYWMTPFLRLSTALPRKAVFEKFLAPFSPESTPCILQLMGTAPELMARASKAAMDLPVIGININLACPSKQVLKSRAGGALLKDPEKIKAILSAIREKCSDISLSVKMRTGFDSPSDMEKIIPALTEFKLDFIVLHHRTVAEMYDKIENGFKRLASAVELAGDTPLIGSGDIFSIEDAERMFSESGCAGVTVARGFSANPFLIRNILNHLAGQPTEDLESEKERYFTTAARIAAENPDVYWRRSSFMELSRLLWGKDHPIFHKIRNMKDPEILEWLALR